jgi:hypothetical protein
VTDPGDESTVYVPFRNTRDFVDILVDLAVGSRGDQEGNENVSPEHQIGVHGGMWTALHPCVALRFCFFSDAACIFGILTAAVVDVSCAT